MVVRNTALLALVSFCTLSKLLEFFKFEKAKTIALLSSSMFLVSGYAVEIVVSKVMIHYMLCSIFTLGLIMNYLSFLEAGKLKHYLFSLIFFVLALFTLELAYMIPFLVLALSLASYVLDSNRSLGFKQHLGLLFSFPMVLLSFLLLHYWVVGAFIGHYGDSHLAFSLPKLSADYLKYLSSYILQFDLWPHKFRNYLEVFALRYYYLLIAAFILISGGIVYFFKRFVKSLQLAVLFLVLFSIALLPVLNLHIPVITPIETDRYGYLASIFVYAAIVLFFNAISSKWLKYPILAIYLITHLALLFGNIHSFAIAANYTKGLLEDFRWYDKDKIYILVQPENAKGARIFSTVTDTSEFMESIYLREGIDLRGKSELVYEMNVNSLQDSIKLQVIDSTRINVSIGWWGSWFWKYHNGAVPYVGDAYHTEIKEDYTFDFVLDEPLKENEVIIYFDKTKWKEVVFTQ